MALVVDSWAKVTAIENYEVVAGELLFRRIFEINPGATAFFSFAQEKEDGKVDESTYQSELFQTHSRAVITTVDSAVGLLKSNSMDTLVSVLKGLGSKHAAMNLEQAHYDLVGQALLDTLAKALGDSFTDPVKEAWVGVYKVIVENMMEGSKQAKNNKEPTRTRNIDDAKAEMEGAMDELKRITAEKVNQAILNFEKQAEADQERIQEEVAAELQRVADFKAKQAAANQSKPETKVPTVDEENENSDEVDDVEVMDASMDASDILYNQRSCAQYVFEKLVGLTASNQ